MEIEIEASGGPPVPFAWIKESTRCEVIEIDFFGTWESIRGGTKELFSDDIRKLIRRMQNAFQDRLVHEPFDHHLIMNYFAKEEAVQMQSGWGQSGGFEKGSIISILHVQDMKQLNNLKQDYYDGTLRDKWVRWFQNHVESDSGIDLTTITATIDEDRIAAVEEYLKSAKIPGKIYLIYCKAVDACFWTTDFKYWQQVGSFTIGKGPQTGMVPQDKDVELLIQVMKMSSAELCDLFKSECPLCTTGNRHEKREVYDGPPNEIKVHIEWKDSDLKTTLNQHDENIPVAVENGTTTDLPHAENAIDDSAFPAALKRVADYIG